MEKVKSGASGLAIGTGLGVAATTLLDLAATGGAITAITAIGGLIWGVEAAENSEHCRK